MSFELGDPWDPTFMRHLVEQVACLDNLAWVWRCISWFYCLQKHEFWGVGCSYHVWVWQHGIKLQANQGKSKNQRAENSIKTERERERERERDFNLKIVELSKACPRNMKSHVSFIYEIIPNERLETRICDPQTLTKYSMWKCNFLWEGHQKRVW